VDIEVGAAGQSMHYCAVDGLIIISPESILVEKSIRQLNSQNITNNQYFMKVSKTVSAESDISWYINHNRFPELWANFMNSQTETRENEFGESVKINFKKEVLGIQNFASWSELDMIIKDDRISLNGITAADDSLNHFLSIFDRQEAVSCQAGKVLPKNTSFFIGFNFSERELFFKNLENYFVHSTSYFKRESHIKEIEKRFRVDTRNTLRKLVDNQVVAAITSMSDPSGKKASLFIVNNDTHNNTKELFESLLQNYARSTKVEFSSLLSEYETGLGKKFRIYKFPYPSLPGIWLGSAFGFAEANYACFWNNNLVFASSKEALHLYLADMENDVSLYRNTSYAEFKQVTENKANINAYLNINRAYGLNKTLFNSNFSKAFEKNEEVLRKFDALGWQVVCEKDIYFNSINLVLNTKTDVEARAAWQNNIGAPLVTKPKIVVNHRNTAAKEIIVQDQNNTLHLVGPDGKLVWSLPVEGRILGEIHQLDYYANGRLQYLFNTKDKLYLLDRTGKKVANFPIVFKSPATNGVSVFDYDNNRKYRYFVACANKKVYAYNHEGVIIKGWKFGQTTGTVITPVQHFRINNKDYIAFKDQTKVYIQNRQGATRVDCSAKFENSKNPLVLNTNGTPKIVATDKSGKVFYLYFNGKYAEKETSRFSENHFFTVADINGNGVPDFIFVDGRQLTVMDENGKNIFSEKFENNLTTGANLYSFSSTQKKIGITDTKENEIYLFDSSGELYNGFPLRGNSEFTIGKLKEGELNLLVGGSTGELYNYILE
jgi:hypothetical protein